MQTRRLENSRALRWLGFNMSVLRQQTRGAIEYWMGGPSLSLTDTPSGSLWSTSLEFHPPGRAAITASNRASASLPHLRLPVIKTPHHTEAYIPHFSSWAFMTLNHSQIFVKPHGFTAVSHPELTHHTELTFSLRLDPTQPGYWGGVGGAWV